jgi:hypothetical protein
VNIRGTTRRIPCGGQVASGFKLWTGEEMPIDVARSAAVGRSAPTIWQSALG